MAMDAKRIEIGSQSNIYTIAFADENQVIGGYANGDIRRWKIEDGRQQGPTMKARSIRSLAVSRDGRWIVSGDTGNKAIVWNATTHEKMREFEHGSGVTAVDISGDGTKVVAGSWANTDTVQIFDIDFGTELLPPLSHSNIRGVKFSPDGSRFATVSNDSGVRVYSTHDGKILFNSGRQASSNASQLVTPLAWSSDGQQLFVASRGKITCFDISDSSFSDWSVHDAQYRVSVASNGRFIACSAGSSASLWDCVSHEQVGSIITHNTDIYCLALSPSGRYLACGVHNSIIIHNLEHVLPSQYVGRGLCALRLPLVQVSDQVLKSWTQDSATNTEMLLSKEITNSSTPSHYLLADRALMRARLKLPALAMADVQESLRLRQSPIGYIAMAVTLLGQGYLEGALWAFDLAFHECEPHDIKLLLLLKSILLFESGNQEDAITRVEHLAMRANDDNDNNAAYLYTQVLGVMYMNRGNYKHAILLLEHSENLAPQDKQCPHLMTISLIFGWSFTGLGIAARQRLCETLYAEGRTTEAAEIFLNIVRRSDEETQWSKATAVWVTDFTRKWAVTLERVGDEALTSPRHADAITRYPTALPPSPPSPAGLLIKQSRARAAKGLWEHALLDANEAVKTDPTNLCGYEAKYTALQGAKGYNEVIDAFESILHAIERSLHPEIRQLRKDYIAPSQAIATIDSITRGVLKSCPFVVIDVTTGYLCNGLERIRIFKADPLFKALVLSMTRKLDDGRIRQVVARFFGYVMLSHVWQGNEPSFQEVNAVKSVWDLPEAPLNEKLCGFCKKTQRLGYRWAWSDTCCIDKSTSSILNQSLTSMYKWYADSAATLVFLADAEHPSKPGDLTRSLWMTRAWTLQELLAPKVILFYDSRWKPYLNVFGENHKRSTDIMQELSGAMKIPHGTITTFSPDDLTVREKLRLASTRKARYVEDVAYSLIGIFNSDIRPHYGEGADALGHLLEEIVSRFGDVTVLAWSGKSSYSSWLPASVSVYNQTPYNPPSLKGEEMETCITELRCKLSQQEALDIYNRINSLPPARCVARRLHLPCIVFSIKKLNVQGIRNHKEKAYRAKVPGLGAVEFTTADSLPLHNPQKLVFVHPWLSHIRGPSDEDAWGSDLESVIDFGSDSEYDTESDEVVPISPLSAIPVPQTDDHTRALRMIARLGQPFNAWLLVQQPSRHYTRVATENEIVVRGLGTNINSKDIRTTILEIL